MTDTTEFEDLSPHQNKVLCILRMISGPISCTASIIIILIICRSKKKLSTTQNRLVLGLSVSDIILSTAVTFVTFPMPIEAHDAWLPLGNTTTCEIQGFFNVFGAIVTPSYNVAICIHYLLKLRFQYSDTTMSKKVEPFLHGIPIVMSLMFATYCLVKDYLNPGMSMCFISDYPRHCSRDLDVECERGEHFARDKMIWFFTIWIFIIVPMVIFSSMTIIYRTVLRQEQRIDEHEGRNSMRSNEYAKMAMYRGLSYSTAWLITFILAAILTFLNIGRSAPPYYAVRVINSFVNPLQGFFNFLVFIYPKVMVAWSIHPEASFFEAFLHALNSNRGLLCKRPNFRLDEEGRAVSTDFDGEEEDALEMESEARFLDEI